MNIPDEDERAWAELGQEQEQIYEDAVKACAAAGVRIDVIRVLEVGLGVKLPHDKDTLDLF